MYTWISLGSRSDLEALGSEISTEYDPQRVIKKLQAGVSSAVRAVLIERNYIDKDYRSTYYNFYSKKGQSYRPDCVRLHFFDETVSFDAKTLRLSCKDPHLEDHYFGYIVLRPTGIATIGRSVLSPDVRTGASGFVITASHKVHLLGYRLAIRGFPSMDQHIDISVCAHAACWSILRHYSEKYSTYREFLTHDITLMAQQFNPGGLVPSKGLEVSHAERVFQEAGTFPVHVARASQGDDSFYRQLHAYVESGFPLFAAMHSQSHAIAIGVCVVRSFSCRTHLPVTPTRQTYGYSSRPFCCLSGRHSKALRLSLLPTLPRRKPYSEYERDSSGTKFSEGRRFVGSSVVLSRFDS